jgi:pimeloyl-ACP methyl ester carboxylesterase
MVSKDSDLQRLIGWSLASDRTAVTDAFAEMMAADLRPELDKIQCPALVLTTWIGYKEYTDHAKTEANVRGQYAKLKGVDIEITDTARHFIMWDDPNWMFAKMDAFLR